MKTLQKYIYALLLIASFSSSSCTKDFAEINTNPNATAAALPETLLGRTILEVVNRNLNRAMRINHDLMQVSVTTIESREFHRYVIRPTESDYMWRNWYLQLTNIRDIYRSAGETQQAGYQTFQAISLILDAWVSSMITDMYGDVPYFESNQGRDFIFQPQFDRQEDIYRDIFNKLDTANVWLASNTNLPAAVANMDPLYNGVAASWRRFGNSLFLRLLMRVSGKEASGAIGKIRQMIEVEPSLYPVMTDVSQSAVLPIGGTTPLLSEFALDRDIDFSGGKGYTEFFINNLNAWQDPRLTVIATTLGLGGGYLGMSSGYNNGSAPEIMSTYLNTLKTDPRLGNIMNYAELQFILAEAALKGFINADPQTYYERGVQSAIQFWSLDVPDGHLSKEDVRWNTNGTFEQQFEQIMLQKYYTLFFTGFESWSEFRRTGRPVLPIGPGVQNGGRMPSRFIYPINTQATNPDNYRAAAAAMGGDNINSLVWWNIPD